MDPQDSLRKLVGTARGWRKVRREYRSLLQRRELELKRNPAAEESSELLSKKRRLLELTDKLERAIAAFEVVLSSGVGTRPKKKLQIPWRAVAGALSGFAAALDPQVQELEQGYVPKGRVIDVPSEPT